MNGGGVGASSVLIPLLLFFLSHYSSGPRPIEHRRGGDRLTTVYLSISPLLAACQSYEISNTDNIDQEQLKRNACRLLYEAHKTHTNEGTHTRKYASHTHTYQNHRHLQQKHRLLLIRKSDRAFHRNRICLSQYWSQNAINLNLAWSHTPPDYLPLYYNNTKTSAPGSDR